MGRFDYFVVFAEMRTGSNFLESNINAIDGLTCHGEVYNPIFVGYPKPSETLGVSLDDREANPFELLERIKSADGLNGFRYFNDHDPRMFDPIMADPRCAKIILTRNPLDSYVSWKIAVATGQWKLTNIKRHREETVVFDAAEFSNHVDTLQKFQVRLLNTLQKSGQTAFLLEYDDLQDITVMNGLATYLEVDGRLDALDKSLKRQNPKPLSDKVENFDEMEDAVARLDRFNLYRTPNFEPRRGPALPNYIAAPSSPLMFLPIKSGPVDAVKTWLAELDGVDVDALQTRFTRKSLRRWKQQSSGHRSFTVVRHPVARAHAAFCDKILSTQTGSFIAIRNALRKQARLPIPDQYPDATYRSDMHRAAFLGFLQFLKSNLAGQTAFRVDPHWATQTEILRGFARIASPDLILREDDLGDDLAILAGQVHKATMPKLADVTDLHAAQLAEIYDREIEAAAFDVYLQDYITFGFEPYA